MKKNIRINGLFDSIIMNCRKRASELDGFKEGDGAIRLCYLPQNSFGTDIIGIRSAFADRFELVARIDVGNYVLNRDGRGEPVDTYAFSALKVASCLLAYEKGLPARSGEDIGDVYDEQHGFAPYHGAVLYELEYEHKIFALLIVSVSGASQSEDEEVARAAEKTLKAWSDTIGASYSVPVSLD